jgi:hypothetical protein
LATGRAWLHLRICLECGKVGCCDDSPNRHASAHACRSDRERAVGSTYSMERSLPRGRARITLEVTVSQPPTEFAIRTTSGPTPFSYRFSPEGAETLVDLGAPSGSQGRQPSLAPFLASGGGRPGSPSRASDGRCLPRRPARVARRPSSLLAAEPFEQSLPGRQLGGRRDRRLPVALGRPVGDLLTSDPRVAVTEIRVAGIPRAASFPTPMRRLFVSSAMELMLATVTSFAVGFRTH